MADMLEKNRRTETKAPTAPVKHRVHLRPRLGEPPAPRIHRWIQWMALFVVAAVAAVLAAVLLAESDEGPTAQPYDRGAEHGEFSLLAVRDLTGVELSRFAGGDAYLDPDYPSSEHGEFSVMAVRDLTGVELSRFAGGDAYLDPDYPSPEHGEFSVMAVRDLTGVELSRFAGGDASLD